MDQYFVKRGETIKGPIGRRSLLRLIAAQKLIDTDGVASNEQGPWKNLVDVRELLLENSNPIIKSSIPVVREWKVCRRLFRRYRVDLKCPNCSEGISITKGKMPTQDTCPNCDVLFALPGSVSDWIEDDMRIRGYDPAAIIEKDNSIIAQVELPFSRHELICRYMKGMGVLLLCGGPIIVFYSFNRWRGSLVNVFPGLNDFVGFCVLLLLIYSAGSAVLMGLFASLRSLDKTHPKVVDRIESALTIATAIGVLGAIIFVVYWSHEEGDVLGSVLFALLITGFMVLPLFAVSKFLEQKNVSIRIFVPIDSDDDGDTDGFIGF